MTQSVRPDQHDHRRQQQALDRLPGDLRHGGGPEPLGEAGVSAAEGGDGERAAHDQEVRAEDQRHEGAPQGQDEVRRPHVVGPDMGQFVQDDRPEPLRLGVAQHEQSGVQAHHGRIQPPEHHGARVQCAAVHDEAGRYGAPCPVGPHLLHQGVEFGAERCGTEGVVEFLHGHQSAPSAPPPRQHPVDDCGDGEHDSGAHEAPGHTAVRRPAR
ncbi:hypothetical protein GCM10020256_01860 [Streptomyces thermocoprophilus]